MLSFPCPTQTLLQISSARRLCDVCKQLVAADTRDNPKTLRIANPVSVNLFWFHKRWVTQIAFCTLKKISYFIFRYLYFAGITQVITFYCNLCTFSVWIFPPVLCNQNLATFCCGSHVSTELYVYEGVLLVGWTLSKPRVLSERLSTNHPSIWFL